MRIDIEEFKDYDRVILKNAVAGIRWHAALEAFEAARRERLVENLSLREDKWPDWRDVYIVKGGKQ